MNNKGLRQTKIYIILVIIFIIALIAIFYLVENNKNSSSAKPLTTLSDSTNVSSNETKIDDNTTEESKNQTLDAHPFSASLSEIIYGYVFDGNYKISINYKNVIFDFNCNNYSEEELNCVEGSGLMRYNNLAIPLYTYKGQENNILNYAENYYIDMKDDYIFLTNNHVGVIPGIISIYNNRGSLIGQVSNVTTGYILNGKKYNVLYPHYNNQELTFYYVENGIIKIGYVDVLDSKRINEIEIISGASIN